MSGPGKRPVASLVDVTRRYGEIEALDGVSLEIQPGEWLGVSGPSGSGKSTLLNLLAGLDSPTSGRVRVDGTDLAELSRAELARFRRRHVGLVFQEFHLLPYLTALENVMVAQHIHSMADEEEAAAALERVGIGDRLSHRPGELSGGEKQRVCVARALINHPRLLLADEPTGNLDEANERRVLELFHELNEEGFTIVVVSHNPEVVSHADRIVELDHGRLASDRAQTNRADRLLVWLWEREQGDPSPAVTPPRDRDLTEARRRGLVESSTAGPGTDHRLTARGREAARDLVRRQRLAETLLARTFEGTEPPPCGRVSPVGPAATEEICALLGHPRECPHGRAIPEAACCRTLQEALP